MAVARLRRRGNHRLAIVGALWIGVTPADESPSTRIFGREQRQKFSGQDSADLMIGMLFGSFAADEIQDDGELYFFASQSGA
ncbi:MAG: hypothetical protein ACREQR_20430 [Candidatus Binataceae bacterium]